MPESISDLDRLGDELERRIASELGARSFRTRARGRRGRRVLVAAAIVGGVALTGAGAVAMVGGLSSDEVERGLPGGALVFEGTDPTCTSTAENVFECTLRSAPTRERLDDYRGSGQLLTDDDGNISGGCRGQDREGLRWTCYVGTLAVDQQILVADLLGQHVDSPTRG